MNLIANGSHFCFVVVFFFLNFFSYTGLVIQVHIAKYFLPLYHLFTHFLYFVFEHVKSLHS